jgi:ParB-like chromosome segregation protein Spo0J
LRQHRDRIRELRRVKASELIANPKNWRTHPPAQRAAMAGVLSEIGYADALLARELPDGSLQLVDGHLRAETSPDQEVPVLILDVDEAEADKILATLDPLASLAACDTAQLDALLRSIETSDKAIQTMLINLAEEAGVSLDEGHGLLQNADGANDSSPAEFPQRFEILVKCVDEAQQTALIERLLAEGIECRALIS